MRCFALSLAFFLTLSLRAESPKGAPPEQTLENVKQFAAAHLDPRENLSCTQVASQTNTRTITVEFVDPSAPRHGMATGIETGALFENVFAVSSGTGFQFDHWGTIHGDLKAVYRYSGQANGKTIAGLIFADQTTGAIARITFRGANQTAHLFCAAQSR